MSQVSLDQKRLSHIRLLAMDIDGVLTDGGVYVLETGEQFRRFNIKDGLGLKQVMAAGIEVVWISSSPCTSALHRGHNLGIRDIFLGVKDKAAYLIAFCQKQGISLEQVAYIGDDLPDLEVMQQVGIAFAPTDAHPSVREIADYVTHTDGGQGAVREVCDTLLDIIQSVEQIKSEKIIEPPKQETRNG